MRPEAFRLKNVVAGGDEGTLLSGANLNLFRGETLAVYGLSNSGKTALLNVIQGIVPIASGGSFFFGEPSRGAKSRPDVIRITKCSQLLERQTIWENLLVIRPHASLRFFLRPGLASRQAGALLREYDLPFLAGDRVDGLSAAQRYVASIFKAWLMGAKIILIDDFPSEMSEEAFDQIRSVMGKLKEEGVSFLIASCRMEPLMKCADRIAFLSGGRILRALENTSENREDLRALAAGPAAPESPLARGTGIGAGEPRLCEIRLETAGGAPLSVSLQRGTVTAVIDRQRSQIALLAGAAPAFSLKWADGTDAKVRGNGKSLILGRQLRLTEEVLDGFPIGDNLCLGNFARFSTAGFLRRNRLGAAVRAFADWHGEGCLTQRENCSGFSMRDRAAVMMYRMILKRPKVLLATLSDEIDSASFRVIGKGLSDLAEQGCAVCLVAANTEILYDFADRYVLASDGGVRYNVPFSGIQSGA